MHKVKFIKTVISYDPENFESDGTFTFTIELPFIPYQGLHLEITGLEFQVETVLYKLEEEKFYCHLGVSKVDDSYIEEYVQTLKDNLWIKE